MAQNAMVWESGLGPLVDSIEAYAARLENAVLAAAAVLARRAEEDAKNNAPWTDRTGDARAGLTGFSVLAEGIVSIYLAHGAEIAYDLILETARGGKFAIIAPTLEGLLPDVFAAIQEQLT